MNFLLFTKEKKSYSLQISFTLHFKSSANTGQIQYFNKTVNEK